MVYLYECSVEREKAEKTHKKSFKENKKLIWHLRVYYSVEIPYHRLHAFIQI